MQLDTETLAKLAAFGTSLQAPEGERLEDIQKARRTELVRKIDELTTQITEIREAARQAALEHDRYLHETRQNIVNDPYNSELGRRYALSDFNRYVHTSSEVFDRELRPIRALERQRRELQNQLDQS